MTVTTKTEVLAAYLNGTNTVIIEGNKTLILDGGQYMSDAGWFANPAQFDVVKKFFETSYSLPEGDYSWSQIAQGVGLPDNKGTFYTKQYLWEDGGSSGGLSLADRTFIFNSVGFEIDKSMTFHVDASGNKTITGLKITPIDDNFDYRSADGFAKVGNPLLSVLTDPNNTGSTVRIDL